MKNEKSKGTVDKKTNGIFYAAIFSLPFENFFFAPSAGWATITPLILLLYLALNSKNLKKTLTKYKVILLLLSIAILLTIINIPLSGIKLENFIGAIISIAFGITSLLSFDVFYENNKDRRDAVFKKITKVLFASYLIIVILGLIEYIAIKTNQTAIIKAYSLLSKRDYLKVGRIQFFYTEPSFIGMHIFGVLLPAYLITKDKKLLIIAIIHLLESIMFSSSVRLFIDIIMVAIIFIYYLLLKKKLYLLMLLMPILTMIMASFASSHSYRFNYILNNGLYSDGSLASRYFRVNASTIGYRKEPVHALFGWGIGNSLIPLRIGYEEARQEYKSNYLREINELNNENFTSDSVTYSLPIRMVSEYGLIISIIVFILMIRIIVRSNYAHKWPLFIIIIYLYLQFESLAFYSLWLLVAIAINTPKTAKERQ